MRTRLTERDLSRIVRRVINEQDENTDELNNELLDYFQKEIDTMRNNISVHKPDTIAGVLRERANDFLYRSQFVQDFGNHAKWGKPKN